MRTLPARHLLFSLLVLLAALLQCGCDGGHSQLDAIRERGELRFVTRNGPSTYYLGRDGPTGFEYELAAGLARELGVELRVREVFGPGDLFAALERGEADIAGAGLALTPRRSLRFTASVPYAETQAQVVYRVGDGQPDTLADLRDLRIAVLAQSSEEQLLGQLRSESADWLRWEPLASVDPLDALTRVRDGSADVAVVSSRAFALQQRLLPQLAVAFDLAAPTQVVWYLPPARGDMSLLLAVNGFLKARDADGRLAALQARLFYSDESIDRVDTRTFMNAVESRLPGLRELLEQVALEHQLPWEFLAAMSYQESHWDPQATSPTGVRGLMMLTRATARDLGVQERTDPVESLRGGARYYNSLRRRLPGDIEEPDRSWLALAAYNIGMAHLEDARVLTERRGGDPHLWKDVMQALPLLEEPRHYRGLRHGYARGGEAARYVQNIRFYNEVLSLKTAQERRPQPPQDPGDYLPAALRRLTLIAM